MADAISNIYQVRMVKMNAINNLNELDSFGDMVDRAIDAAKDKQASDEWDNLCEFTDNLVIMDDAARLDAIITQPNLVSEAIKVLGWRAGMSKDIVRF